MPTRPASRRSTSRTARLGPWPGGIDQKAAPYSLPPEKVADAQNVLFDDTPGQFNKRNGSLLLTTLPSGKSARDAYVFIKSDGTQYLLASDGSTLYYTTDPATQGSWTSLKTGLTAAAFMEFETAYDQVWMTNGVDSVMSWDGTTLTVYDREQTSTADSQSVSGTTINNNQFTQADDYWNGQSLVFTTGANQGTVVTVTDFDNTNGVFTFTPAVSGAQVTDRFKVGLIIPAGKVIRFWDGKLFIGATATNASELRFTTVADPNTGAFIQPNHPLAWPAVNSLSVNVNDGDRVWVISPVFRDRIMVAKNTGLFRIERDPLTLYHFEVVTRFVGSRFPRSWAEKGSALWFLGQYRDGLPTIFKTDMVSAAPVDPNGGLDPLIWLLKQPNSIQETVTLASQSDWNAGARSTFTKALPSNLGIDNIGTDISWASVIQSGSNIDIESTPGKVAILGSPVWSSRYEADVLPQNATPAWTIANVLDRTITASGSILAVTQGTDLSAAYTMTQTGLFASGQDAYVSFRIKVHGNNSLVRVRVSNGAFAATVSVTGFSYGSDTWFVFHVLLKADGTASSWRNGLRIDADVSVAAASDNVFQVLFAGAVGDSGYLDYAYDHTNFKGNQLSSQGGAVSPTTMPDTLPTSGTIVVQNDYPRAPDALRRVYQTQTLYSGTIAISSWTASTSDFSSGTDPSGYLSVTNGNAPTSQVKQYHRIKSVLTLGSDFSNNPEIDGMVSGMLFVSAPIFIGSSIAAWSTFIDAVSAPAGTTQTIKIRAATVFTEPVEGDWGAWITLANGDNIGTDLSDGSPPSTRWVELKVEQGPSSAGVTPYVQGLTINWLEGSSTNLPLQSVIHKQRYMMACAQGSSAANDTVVVSDRRDAWTRFSGMNLSAILHFKTLFIGFDSVNSNVYSLDVANKMDDNGTAIDAYVVTREEMFEEESARKNMEFSYVHFGPNSGPVTLTFKRPGVDADFTGSKVLTPGTAGADIRQNFSRMTTAKRIQRKYRNNTIGQNFAVRGETVRYDILPLQPT